MSTPDPATEAEVDLDALEAANGPWMLAASEARALARLVREAEAKVARALILCERAQDPLVQIPPGDGGSLPPQGAYRRGAWAAAAAIRAALRGES